MLRDRNLMRALVATNSVLHLSPHIGFYSSRYSAGPLSRLRYRLRVVTELLCFFGLLRKASEITFKGESITPIRVILRDRIFGGSGSGEPVRLAFGQRN